MPKKTCSASSLSRYLVFIGKLYHSKKWMVKLLHYKFSRGEHINGLPNVILKSVRGVILMPSTICLNQCQSEDLFSSKIKIPKVVPIFKNGSRDNPASYRPVFLVPVFAKLLERIRIMHYQLILFWVKLSFPVLPVQIPIWKINYSSSWLSRQRNPFQLWESSHYWGHTIITNILVV